MKDIYLANIRLNELLAIISNYRIAGIFPLDILAHLGISIIITLIILRKTKSYKIVFATLFALGLLKEYYDSFSLNSHILEHLKDMIINLIYPFISWSIHKLKYDQ